ncbi:hypothetical protein D1814_13145 [Alteromonas sp. BL110]|nr:hypothetical protein D1814_13145 [Alteromonas sp. BL110]RKM81958.1 hypothetical protein D7031_06405 [Alteromonas sp. BL110]
MNISVLQIVKYIAYMLSIIVLTVFSLNTATHYFSLNGRTEIVVTSIVVFIISLLCTIVAKKLNVFPSPTIKR